MSQLTITLNAAQWRAAYKPIEGAWQQLEEAYLADEVHDAARRDALDNVTEAILDAIEPLDDHADAAPTPADDARLSVTLPRQMWQHALPLMIEVEIDALG